MDFFKRLVKRTHNQTFGEDQEFEARPMFHSDGENSGGSIFMEDPDPPAGCTIFMEDPHHRVHSSFPRNGPEHRGSGNKDFTKAKSDEVNEKHVQQVDQEADILQVIMDESKAHILNSETVVSSIKSVDPDGKTNNNSNFSEKSNEIGAEELAEDISQVFRTPSATVTASELERITGPLLKNLHYRHRPVPKGSPNFIEAPPPSPEVVARTLPAAQSKSGQEKQFDGLLPLRAIIFNEVLESTPPPESHANRKVESSPPAPEANITRGKFMETPPPTSKSNKTKRQPGNQSKKRKETTKTQPVITTSPPRRSSRLKKK